MKTRLFLQKMRLIGNGVALSNVEAYLSVRPLIVDRVLQTSDGWYRKRWYSAEISRYRERRTDNAGVSSIRLQSG